MAIYGYISLPSFAILLCLLLGLNPTTFREEPIFSTISRKLINRPVGLAGKGLFAGDADSAERGPP